MAKEASGKVAPDHLIHPLSPIGRSQPIVFTRGRGLRLWDAEDREYLDAVSGLWNVLIGYGRTELARSAELAIERFGFASLYFSQSHEFAERLAAKLASVCPAGIEHFFFTSEGSTAIDTAIKIVRYEAALTGRPEKTKIIARWKSYHGSSLGSAIVTGQPEFWRDFGPVAPGIVHIPQPSRQDPDSAAELEIAIEREGPETIAAFIAEPVSLPSGVELPGEQYWPRVRELCDKYHVRLIADEVVTGFGRTGRQFALEHWGVRPDLLVMSKGLTSGYAPLAAVGVADEVYEGIMDDRRLFMHGFTTSGHPVCANIALGNLQLIEQEGLVERAARAQSHIEAVLSEVADRHPQLGEVRALGMLAGVDVLPGRDMAQRARAGSIAQAAREQRLLIRSYEDAIVVAPSLIATDDDIAEIGERLSAALA